MIKVYDYNFEKNETKILELQDVPDVIIPEDLPIPTMEQMAIALLQTQAELKKAQTALDFLLMGGM